MNEKQKLFGEITALMWAYDDEEWSWATEQLGALTSIFRSSPSCSSDKYRVHREKTPQNANIFLNLVNLYRFGTDYS
jgi:hypothetical protein